MKKAIAAIILIMLTTVTGYANLEIKTFKDVMFSDWCYQDVIDMTEKGVIKGCSDGKFHPEGTLTYGEFIKMAVISYTGTDPGVAEDGSHWARKYYDLALEKELINEVDIPKSVLSAAIPRKHMSLIVANTFPGEVIADYDIIKNSIKDLDVGKDFEHAIIKSYGLGIIAGYTDGNFKPNGYLIRSEAAAVVSRLTNEARRVYPDIEKLKAAQEKATANANRPTDIAGLSKTSESTLLIEDMVKNFRTYANGWFSTDAIKYYEIITNYPYEMTITQNLIGTQEGIETEYENGRYAILIKDNKIIAKCANVKVEATGRQIYYVSGQATIPTFDYIGFYSTGDTIFLLLNPFNEI